MAQPLPPPIPSPREQSQPEQDPTTQDTQTRQPNQQPPEEPIPTVEQAKSPQNNTKTNDARQNPTQSTAPNWINWLTGVLVFVGFMQFFAMSLQARYMRRGLAVTQQAADAATENAHAATLSAQTATQALHTLERAMIVQTGNWSLSYSPEPHVAFSIMNIGRTRGMAIEIAMGYEIAAEFPPAPQYTRHRRSYPLPLFPQDPMPISFPIENVLPAANTPAGEQPQDGTMFLWIYVHVTYKDVFEIPHETGCTTRWKPPYSPLSAAYSGNAWFTDYPSIQGYDYIT